MRRSDARVMRRILAVKVLEERKGVVVLGLVWWFTIFFAFFSSNHDVSFL